MKKVISLTLVLVVLLSCIGLVACNEVNKEGTVPPPSGNEVSSPSVGEPAQLPSTGSMWDDMPIYPGATTDKEKWFSVKMIDVLTPIISESRSYETNDSLKAVVDFYKSEMPKNGWGRLDWTQLDEANENGEFVKNEYQDHQDRADVRLKDLGDNVHIFLHRRGVDIEN